MNDSAADPLRDEEVARYRAQLDQNPDSLVFAALVEALRKRGRLGEAVEAGREGVSRHPDYTAGLMALAKTLYEAGELAESLEMTTRILRAATDHVAGMRLKGMIEQAQGNLTAAARTYKRVLLVSPKDVAAQTLLQALEESRAPQTAVEEDAEELQLATMTLVELFQKQGYRKRAREACQRILAQEPTRQDALQKLVELGERPPPPWMQTGPRSDG